MAGDPVSKLPVQQHQQRVLRKGAYNVRKAAAGMRGGRIACMVVTAGRLALLMWLGRGSCIQQGPKEPTEPLLHGVQPKVCNL